MKHAHFFYQQLVEYLAAQLSCAPDRLTSVDVTWNLDQSKQAFGDLSTNAALVLSKVVGRPPRELAQTIIAGITVDSELASAQTLARYISKLEIAGPGFINITLDKSAWNELISAMVHEKSNFFIPQVKPTQKILVEFVSANPTGPLHVGHGRGGIIGDTFARVASFLGYTVSREFYINDAGSQITRLGESLRARVQQELGQSSELPENGYAGAYVVDVAKQCIAEHGAAVVEQPTSFFADYAKKAMLAIIKGNLTNYNIHFDTWFSEKTLHESGAIEKTIEELRVKDMVYEEGGALWFRSTAFGDDKDRVVRKQDGELTYIAADIAYHKNKFDRGFDLMIDVLGQDHHGYVKRLKATVAALGYNSDALEVILYQLVSIKKNDELVKMSKRAGNFEQLGEVIELVGADVARFFYLHRKADAHLEFDLEVALKKTDENPVYYIHYAYVRTKSILAKAAADAELGELVAAIMRGDEATLESAIAGLSHEEYLVVKKIWSLQGILQTMIKSYQTHTLAYYTFELAQLFHHYYAHHHVINREDQTQTTARLVLVTMVQQTLDLCLDLLGLSKPEKM